MKILFIYHNVETKNLRHFPYGIGLLSATLKKHGHETALIYIHDDINELDLVNLVREANPSLIAFSTVTLQWEFTKKYARLIKKEMEIPIICGGPHPTFMPEETIREPSINMICIGEGELPLLDVVNRLENHGDLSSIPNIWVKNEFGTLFKNPIRKTIENLDELEFPDRQIIPYQNIIDENKTEPIFITSRGCPYECAFCSNSAIKTLYKGKGRYIRQRSPENVIKEIVTLREQYRFSSLNFYDEAFGYNRKWVKQFCDLYRSELGYPFGAFIRAETMDRKTLHMLSQAGLKLIYIGLESGNENIRRKVMNRHMSNDQIIQTCRDAQAEGIQVWTFNIVGVPGETVDTIKETMELNKVIHPHFASISIYQPFPGTKLYDYCNEKGYISKDFSTNLYEGSVLSLPSISNDQLMHSFQEFQSLSNEMRMDHENNGDKIFLVDF